LTDFKNFSLLQWSIFTRATQHASVVFDMATCLDVCHTPGLCLNG